ncbi:MAG: hypothetical protein MUE85_19700 [Microscillaceae bacterium]|jgi:hypothetical protein|nr:hypothetical protein [Microscillaceae bacterium]
MMKNYLILLFVYLLSLGATADVIADEPAPPSGESAPNLGWYVIIVVLVAVAGLVWMYLRRNRKKP